MLDHQWGSALGLVRDVQAEVPLAREGHGEHATGPWEASCGPRPPLASETAYPCIESSRRTLIRQLSSLHWWPESNQVAAPGGNQADTQSSQSESCRQTAQSQPGCENGLYQEQGRHVIL